MKKFAVILVLLSLTRVGVAYADTNSSTTYFFGEKNATANLNQVLALLIGPKGEPGKAGVVGKNGLNGKDGRDGVDGKDGAQGPQGLIGPPGSSILTAAFSGVRGPCTNGGFYASDGNGNIVYSCNGTNGTNGLNGANGTNGTNGTGGGSGGGTLGYGQGEVSVGACEADNKIVIQPTRTFTGTDFVFTAFNLGDPTVTDGDIHDTCAGKTVSIYLKIKASSLTNTSGHYLVNDIVKCTYTLPAAGAWVNTKWQFTMTNSNSNCATIANNTSVALNEISTADYTDKIGFEIG